ncbi:TPA: Arc family DNA-binding protein [Klebsiella aerogenes]
MGREDPQFNLRLPYELKEKVKQRAKANGRSLNAELIQIISDYMSKPPKLVGYKDDVEMLADQQSDVVKKMVFDTLKDIYSRGNK